MSGDIFDGPDCVWVWSATDISWVKARNAA